MRSKKKLNPRIIGICVLLLVIVALFGVRLLNFQLFSAEEYASQSNSVSTRTSVIKSARGEILDCYGRPIAVNREGYDIVFNSAYIDKNKLNDTILTLTKLLKKNKTDWVDNLPITKKAKYKFNGTKSSIATLKSKLGLNDYATVENCIDAMVEEFNLQEYNSTDRRTIMGVRYSMLKADFSISAPYTFAEDISNELMIYIKESLSSIDGVEISIVTYREYTDGTLAPHIIGNVGKITAEEWPTLKDKNYSYNDSVGKSGVEKAFEDYLKGTDGLMSYKVDNKGNILSSEVTVEPKQGNTVMLSIDKRLQSVAQQALKDSVVTKNKKGGKVTGAAAVAVNVKTGQVLAAANYPSYNLLDYNKKYSKLATDSTKPLFDRSFSGVYQPGSTFKPAVAVAGLETGKITKSETITCVRTYRYFKGFTPSCLHYHGSINLKTALAKSCNYYFYEVGRRVGIKSMNKYCRQFGLGEYTGIEVTESKGILAGPEYSESVGRQWYPGNVVQAAIGQIDNTFTPLQLAMYTATVANGGTRYRATLLSEVRSYNLDERIKIAKGEVLNKVDASKSTFDAVKNGMLSVTQDGTAQAYFENYPVKVGGKTGTSQNNGADHSVFTVFAPFDDPEIAISVVVEHGEYNSTTGPVAKAMLDEYFYLTNNSYSESKTNSLLK